VLQKVERESEERKGGGEVVPDGRAANVKE